MDKQQLKKYFRRKKIGLLRGLISQDRPMAFILGGQPVSGKSKLANSILAKYPDKNLTYLFRKCTTSINRRRVKTKPT